MANQGYGVDRQGVIIHESLPEIALLDSIAESNQVSNSVSPRIFLASTSIQPSPIGRPLLMAAVITHPDAGLAQFLVRRSGRLAQPDMRLCQL